MGRLIAVLLVLAVQPATLIAQTRPSSTALPCSAARQLVFSRGAVVLGTGGYSYDRFVRDRTFCEFSEYIVPAWVPATDNPQCFVGYRCRPGPRDWWGD